MGGEKNLIIIRGPQGGTPKMAIFAVPPLWVPRKLRKNFIFQTMACGISNCRYFDGEFIYGTHCGKPKFWKKFGLKIQKKSKFLKIKIFSNYGMWHIKLQVFWWEIQIWNPFCRKSKFWKYILDQNFGPKIQKRSKFRKLIFFKLWHVAYQTAGFFMGNSKLEFILWKIEILKKFDPKFWTKCQKSQMFGKSIFFQTMACGISNCRFFHGEFSVIGY